MYSWFKIKDFWYRQVSSRLFPRQRWLTRKIPRKWCDKDSLIEIVILECIKHYVEGEKALEMFVDDGFLTEVKENYELITVKLPELEKKLEEAWAEIPKVNFASLKDDFGRQEYNAIYGVVEGIGKEITELKTKVMLWAVSRRESMWS